jgi:hypothetical protein
MMSVRDWADQELLTSAALNELLAASCMRFANTAARDAFCTGDLAPQPGMIVFMLDTNRQLIYIVVNSVGYWAPMPHTPCFYAQQAATQPLALNTFVAIAGYTLANHGNRNYGNWLDATSGKFTPKVPGLYEFTGGMSMTSGPVGATFTHRAGFRLNGTGNTTYHVASASGQIVTTNVPVSFSVRKFILNMNGTTDYVELIAYASTATSTNTGAMAPVFSAKYLGQ